MNKRRAEHSAKVKTASRRVHVRRNIPPEEEDLGPWFDLWEKCGADPERFRTEAEEQTALISKMKPDFMEDERFARIVFLAVTGTVSLADDLVPCEPPSEKDSSEFPLGR